MARQRFRRKDLKRPDEFVTQGRALLEWSQENVRVLAWVAGGVVVLALGLAGFFSVRTARVRQANEDLAVALGQFHAGNYGQAAAQLSDVANRWQSTDAGRIAGLYAATADLRADNFEAASTLLQQALAEHEWPPYLHQQAMLALAVTLERKGDAQAAIARYAETAALSGPYTALALLGEARLREQVGEKDKARDLYERFTKDFPQAPEADVVTAKLQSLKS